ncbi:MAG: LPS export ABC transporter periplasmic protein LptC [Prevotella sp.]|nr:LPS export ABC transporter periplasmic protein LptC [Prevotella sp.]
MSHFKKRKISLVATAVFAVVTLFFMSCKEEAKNMVALKYDPDKVPSLSTDSVTMLVSDSGLIRYKMIAKTWEMYNKAKEPHQLFPHGFYLEQFDSVFNIVATVKSDSAWNYMNRRLWKLRGHVSIRNVLGETFMSNELFWDERQQKIYSNEYVEIIRPNKVILRNTGGFTANQQLTEYTFRDVGDTPLGGSLLYVNEDGENKDEKEE